MIVKYFCECMCCVLYMYALVCSNTRPTTFSILQHKTNRRARVGYTVHSLHINHHVWYGAPWLGGNCTGDRNNDTPNARGQIQHHATQWCYACVIATLLKGKHVDVFTVQCGYSPMCLSTVRCVYGPIMSMVRSVYGPMCLRCDVSMIRSVYGPMCLRRDVYRPMCLWPDVSTVRCVYGPMSLWPDVDLRSEMSMTQCVHGSMSPRLYRIRAQLNISPAVLTWFSRLLRHFR